MDKDERPYKPDGVVEFLGRFCAGIESKKLVALFDSYKTAKSDLIIEMCNNNNLLPSDVEPVIEKLEELCDMEEWFSLLGTRK
jgi:hypothetical protein